VKITDIKIQFIPNSRPRVMVTFDKSIAEADLTYVAAKDKDHDVWVYRGQDGDYIHCGVEVRPKGAQMKQDRVKMADGYHPVWPLQNTNSVAVNSLLRMCDPVMDVAIDTGNETYALGHCDVVAVAKYLYANMAHKEADGEGPAMACIEWPSGIRVYEPVRCVWNEETWDAAPNRQCDKIMFLCTPDDKLTPIYRAIAAMKN
jgi:hypothetical protein